MVAPTLLGTSMNGEATNRKILCDISRTAFEVVNRLLARDQLLARELRSDTTTSRQIYREECITVEMAATLRERFPQNVEIRLFTPPEETRTGADWYWRFEQGERAVHARVQAKRVRRSEFGQADRDGDVEFDDSQLDDLIQATVSAASQLRGLQAWVATFARFDATPPCRESNLLSCRRHRHDRACADHKPSLWIAQASEIRQLNGASMPVRTVVENSVRLDCILPCIDGSDAREGPAMKGFMLGTGLPPYQDCIDRIRQDSTLLKSFEGALRITV